MVDMPIGTVTLTFRDQAAFDHVASPFAEDLSAVARHGSTLFLSCDETAGIERLTRRDDGTWGDQEHFNLAALFDLPDGPDGEMDIEGVAIDDGWLWMVGSHSLKRRRPKPDSHPAAEALARMGRIERDDNRFFLGRVPLLEDRPGHLTPAARAGHRRPEALKLARGKSRLLRWLRHDDLLKPYFDLPSKENGFDIEGLAVRGRRIWLGLRGPVLRGLCVIIELDLSSDADRAGRLKARRIGGGVRYRKYLLDSAGLGVRDLHLDGNDLLVLLGPTMSADGPAKVLRWRDAVDDQASGVVDPRRCSIVAEPPYRGPVDHPEGLTLWTDAGPGVAMIVYDAPSPLRLDRTAHSVKADLFRLSGADDADND